MSFIGSTRTALPMARDQMAAAARHRPLVFPLSSNRTNAGAADAAAAPAPMGSSAAAAAMAAASSVTPSPLIDVPEPISPRLAESRDAKRA
jgi:hypothetical protein